MSLKELKRESKDVTHSIEARVEESSSLLSMEEM